MRSSIFKEFGIPDAECDVELKPDPYGVPRLWFWSTSNAVVGLDMTGAHQLAQMLSAAGEESNASMIRSLIGK